MAPVQKILSPGTQEVFNGAGTQLEIKNDTKKKGEYDVVSAGATPPANRNVYIQPKTSERWVLLPHNQATVTNAEGTTLTVTRF